MGTLAESTWDLVADLVPNRSVNEGPPLEVPVERTSDPFLPFVHPCARASRRGPWATLFACQGGLSYRSRTERALYRGALGI